MQTFSEKYFDQFHSHCVNMQLKFFFCNFSLHNDTTRENDWDVNVSGLKKEVKKRKKGLLGR